MTTPGADAEGPAERALEARLEDVRLLPPEVDPRLAAAIVRTARWQRAVRAPLVLAGMLCARRRRWARGADRPREGAAGVTR